MILYQQYNKRGGAYLHLYLTFGISQNIFIKKNLNHPK